MLRLFVIFLTYLLTISSVQAAHIYTIDPPPCSINPAPSTSIFAGVSTNISVTSTVSLFSISLDSSPALPGLPKSKNTQPLFPFTYTWANPQLDTQYTFTANVVDSISGNAGSCAQVYTPVAAPPSLPDAPENFKVSCPAPGNFATLLDFAIPGISEYQLNGSKTFTNPMPTIPGITYTWGMQACNSTGCSSSVDYEFTCSDATAPWIQVWGDVHSNTRIYAPGGP